MEQIKNKYNLKDIIYDFLEEHMEDLDIFLSAQGNIIEVVNNKTKKTYKIIIKDSLF